MDDIKIKIFENDEKSLKALGELLSNESSRKIIRLLINQELYFNEIAAKGELRPNLVIHHLKKLEEIGAVQVTHKKIIRKGVDHKYYKMAPGILILPTENKKEVQEKGLLTRIFKEGVKFSCLSFAAIMAFLFSGGIRASEFGDGDLPDPLRISPLIYAMFVIIIGLLFFYFSNRKSKR